MLGGGIPERTAPQFDNTFGRAGSFATLLGLEAQPFEDAEQRICVVCAGIRLVSERTRPAFTCVASARTTAVRIVRESVDQHAVQLAQRVFCVCVRRSTEEHSGTSTLPSTLHDPLDKAGVLELLEVESRGRDVDAETFGDRRRVKRKW
jgi:hypothetical protein